MAKLIKEKQPKLYDFLYTLRRKNEVLKYLDLKEMTPILHTSGMYGSDHGNTRMVAPIAAHPTNKNSIIVFTDEPELSFSEAYDRLEAGDSLDGVAGVAVAMVA